MDFAGKKVLVVGLARSGVAAAKVLAESGARVWATDNKTKENLDLGVLTGLDITIVAGINPDLTDIKPDLLVLSPGVPHGIPPIQAAKELCIPLWSEIELAYQLTDSPIVAITGTNGKTTTTALVGKLLHDAAVPSVVAGNIGKALTLEVSALKGGEIIVAEVSSFQLECIHDFRARVAVVTNITPDHLDRHGTLENYIAAKARVLENQTRADWAVLNYDDPVVRAMARGAKGKILYFSIKEELAEGICLNGSELVLRTAGQETKIINRQEIFIRGDHNLENAMAATGVAWALGLEPHQIAHTLREFTGVTHRQEFVADIRGVRFINDSKGTNPDASIKALLAFEEPIVLIAGGKNKGCDFTDFMAAAKPRVKELVLVGSAAEELAQAAQNQGMSNIHRTASFEHAVDTAAALAKPGDIVLLSPACTSWDMFSSFEERGDLFKELVRRRLQDKA